MQNSRSCHVVDLYLVKTSYQYFYIFWISISAIYFRILQIMTLLYFQPHIQLVGRLKQIFMCRVYTLETCCRCKVDWYKIYPHTDLSRIRHASYFDWFRTTAHFQSVSKLWILHQIQSQTTTPITCNFPLSLSPLYSFLSLSLVLFFFLSHVPFCRFIPALWKGLVLFCISNIDSWEE